MYTCRTSNYCQHSWQSLQGIHVYDSIAYAQDTVSNIIIKSIVL